MQTTDQVAGEAREKLADAIAGVVEMWGEFGRTTEVRLDNEDWAIVVAALRAQPERGAEEWNYDMSAAPVGQNNPVLVSVPAFAKGHDPFVAEAYFYTNDGRDPGEEGWWWYGTGPEDYGAGPIRETNAEPIAWRHLPEPATLPLHPAKDEGGGR